MSNKANGTPPTVKKVEEAKPVSPAPTAPFKIAPVVEAPGPVKQASEAEKPVPTATEAKSVVASLPPVKPDIVAPAAAAPVKPATAVKSPGKTPAGSATRTTTKPAGKAAKPASRPAAKPAAAAVAARAPTPPVAPAKVVVAVSTTAQESPKAEPRPAADIAKTVQRMLPQARQAAEAIATPVDVLLTEGLAQARKAYELARASQEALNERFMASAAATSKGLAELNGQMFDLVRSQSDIALDLWRRLMDARTLSEAVQVQTREVRRHYEATAEQVKDIAETASRVANDALAPVQAAFADLRKQLS